ncbi:MAG: hypothetical protein K6A44_02850 [bacterium]|nr:hypothetical protein [bacterium]
MIKKISTATLMVLLIGSSALADTNLREPQGRIGTYFKTEKIAYPPINLSVQELENLHKYANKNNETTNKKASGNAKKQQLTNTSSQDKKKEEQNLKDMQRQRLAEKRQIELQKEKEEKEIQKQKLVEQKQLDANKKIEDKEQLAAKKLEEKRLKQEEKAERAAKKLEEKKLKQEEKANAILSHKNNDKEEKEPKLIFRLGKKEKNKVETEPEVTSKNTENVETAPEDTNIAKYVQDNDTKNIVKEIKTELTDDRPQMLQELSTLWVSAVQKSDTVYFAIMKLSNPNGEEVNKNGFKKILEPILGAAPLVGQAFVNPALTAGSIIGSNVMGTMINDGAKARLTKVNDADLVILARAIDELQESLLMNYMAYKGAKEAYELAVKIAEERQQEYEEMNKKNSPNTILANTFYTEALDYQYKTRQDFLMKRIVLEQMVGTEALNEIENPQKEETPAEDNTEPEVKKEN